MNPASEGFVYRLGWLLRLVVWQHTQHHGCGKDADDELSSPKLTVRSNLPVAFKLTCSSQTNKHLTTTHHPVAPEAAGA